VGNWRAGPRKIGSIGAVVALVLCLPPRPARARPRSCALDDCALSPVGAALAHPQQIFDVIQSAGGADSADVARTVRGTVRSRVVKRQFRALRSVSASVTGAGLLRLTKRHDIYAITPNSRVTSTVSNPQKWPRATEIDWYWGSPFAKAGAATIAIVDSGIDTSNRQFGDRRSRRSTSRLQRARVRTVAVTERSSRVSPPARAASEAPPRTRSSSR
jgi:hypothetical protein